MSTIVISGGSRGLGHDLAFYLAERGHQVVTFARGPAPSTPGVVHIPDIDVRSREQLETLEPYLRDADGLVNNVGTAYDGILATQGGESMAEMLEVNVLSVLYLTKLYLRARLAQRVPGNVVTVSSIISERGYAGLATYAATKGALNSMTRALAREMGSRGVRVNAVLPGYFASELSKGLTARKREQIVRRTPLGRLATTDDICPVVEFLLSDASRFMTGQLLTVDGGLTV